MQKTEEVFHHGNFTLVRKPRETEKDFQGRIDKKVAFSKSLGRKKKYKNPFLEDK